MFVRESVKRITLVVGCVLGFIQFLLPRVGHKGLPLAGPSFGSVLVLCRTVQVCRPVTAW